MVLKTVKYGSKNQKYGLKKIFFFKSIFLVFWAIFHCFFLDHISIFLRPYFAIYKTINFRGLVMIKLINLTNKLN